MTTTARAAVAVIVLAIGSRAGAFPAFARKYGMACSACHEAWPVLNAVGTSFRDDGYRFRLGKDVPTELRPEYVPIALRSVPAWTLTRATNQPSDAGPVTVQHGGVEPPGVDVLTGGAVSEGVSFLLVLAGFTEDEAAGVESAWARLDRIGGTSWLNLRVGKHELDLPASSHRGIALTSGYAVYGAHPMGSAVTFDLGETQLGVELSGHDARSATRYAISVVTANGASGLSGNGWSAPVLYGHLQQAFAFESALLPSVRVGALGAIGWWPTRFATDGGAPVAGTGAGHERYYRLGGELAATLGYPARPLLVTAAYVHGREAAGLASGVDPASGADLATLEATFDGGFVEVDWVPITEAADVGTPWVVFARWDEVRFARGAGDVQGGTLGVRRYLALGPRASAAVHLEVHADRVRQVGWTDPSTGVGRDARSGSALLGIDLDF